MALTKHHFFKTLNNIKTIQNNLDHPYLNKVMQNWIRATFRFGLLFAFLVFSGNGIVSQSLYIENIDESDPSNFGNIDVYDLTSGTLLSVMQPNEIFNKSEGWQMVGKDGLLFYFQITDSTKPNYGQIDTWDGTTRANYGNLNSEFDPELWNLSGVDDGLLYFQAYDPSNQQIHSHIDTWDGTNRQSSIARIRDMVVNDDANIMTGMTGGNFHLQWINSGGSYGDRKSWDGTMLVVEQSVRSIYGLSGQDAEIYRMAGIEADPIPANPSVLLNSISRLKAHIEGSMVLTANELIAERAIIELNQTVLAIDSNAIREAFCLVELHDNTLGALFTEGTASEAGFSSNADGFELEHIMMSVQQAILDHSYPTENLTNYPDLFENAKFETSSYFPGAVDIPSNPNALQTIQIDGTHLRSSGTQAFSEEVDEVNPTGCYLAPGTVAEVTVPQSLVDIGASIRVGAHTWDLKNKPNIRRLHRVTKTYEISSTTFTIGNPLGGGIYILVPFGVDLGILDLEMKNVVRSPFYSRTVANQTSLDEWLTVQRNNPAPWADFETEKFMMQVPTSWIYAMDNPESLMDDYDVSMDAVSETHGRPLIRTKKVMYFQVDVQFRGEAWFPGYPMSNANYNPYDTHTDGYNISHWSIAGPRINTSTLSIMFHELGHQEQIFKFMGEVEASVHLPFMAYRTKAFGVSIEEAFTTSFEPNMNMTIDSSAVSWMITSNFRMNNQMSDISGGREAAYQHRGWGKYAEIVRMFGWKPIDKYFESFSIDADNGIFQQSVNGTNLETDDRILRLSKAAGIDLRPLIHFWGIHPQDPEALENEIESDPSIVKSCLIRDQLQYYKTLIPMTNQTFRDFGLNYFSEDAIENYQGINIWSFQEGFFKNWWNDYGPDEANGAVAEVDLILDLYFSDDFTEIPYNGIDDDCNTATLDDDLDQDGFAQADDCDDNNPNINPDQSEEPYNGIDDDCNTATLDDDLDQDGFAKADDCDDNNPNINPNQSEEPYNGIDDDCNTATLDDDLDQDGFVLADDCDDNNPNINPDQEEDPYNGIDDDCNTTTLDDDLDQDGFVLANDCDDNNPNINPTQTEEPYNGIDDDCNPSTLDDDLDQDGFVLADDCDDNNPNINPDQSEEPYNGIDDDCNPSTFDDDLDQDGFVLADDCDDNNPNINPTQSEEPYNGIDDDCNPSTLDDDLDQDGFVLADDCDDNNPNINPNEEEIVNNGVDEDCDGMDLTSSINEIWNTQVLIYPNPTNDKINLYFSSEISFIVNLYDLTGTLLSSKENSNQLKVSSLNQGAYILEIIDLNTRQILIEKIIIAR